MTSKKRDQNGNLCFKRRFFVPGKFTTWGACLGVKHWRTQEMRYMQNSQNPMSDVLCNEPMFFHGDFIAACLSADDLPSSFPPWNSKSEKWEQSLWNLSKPTKRIHFLIISGWISCFIQFEKAVVQDFLGILQPLGKKWPPRRFRELGKWSTASVCSSSWLPKWAKHRWWANTSRMVGQ